MMIPARAELAASQSYHLRTLRRYLSNPPWLLMYLLGRFEMVRRVVTTAVRWTRPARQRSTRPTLFPDLRLDEALAAVRRDGYFGPLRLPPETLHAISEFAATHDCHPDRDPDVRFRLAQRTEAERRLGQPILLARYSNTAEHCPAIAQLQNDPLLEEMASRYIGAPARHIGNRLWWSFARESTAEEQLRSGQAYHWDHDDYRTLTVFFYITEVDRTAGPHVLVRGSHRQKPLRWLWSFFKARSEDQVLGRYGRENEVTLCGPAGFGFVEDLLCFHKGLAPERKDRLLLQIRYGLFDYGNAHDRLPEARPRAAAAQA